MRLLIGLLFTFALAAACGLGATWLAVTEGVAFGGVRAGSWTAWPKNGTVAIDPYARAAMARSGALPLGSGDGVAFLARQDDAGNPLDGRCDVTLTGTTPAARFWTLTVSTPEGRLLPNPMNRHGITSQEAIRREDGSVVIVLAPNARAGNWVPTGGVDRYMLTLRLYETSVGVATRTGRETTMPRISLGTCR